jgi:hypothetical protein
MDVVIDVILIIVLDRRCIIKDWEERTRNYGGDFQ